MTTVEMDPRPQRAELLTRDAKDAAAYIARWLDAVELIGRPATEVISDEWRDTSRFVVRQAIDTLAATLRDLWELDELLAQLGDDFVEATS
jgi:hypothetical protein